VGVGDRGAPLPRPATSGGVSTVACTRMYTAAQVDLRGGCRTFPLTVRAGDVRRR
jgi:hypothetical protein